MFDVEKYNHINPKMITPNKLFLVVVFCLCIVGGSLRSLPQYCRSHSCPLSPLCTSFGGRGRGILQTDIVEEVASIAHDRAGAVTESKDNKGAYTTVVLVGEKDEVIAFERVLDKPHRTD